MKFWRSSNSSKKDDDKALAEAGRIPSAAECELYALAADAIIRDRVARSNPTMIFKTAFSLERINAACRPHNFSGLFRGETTISRAIAQLGEKTNLEEVKRLTQFTPEEETEKQKAETELAQLRSQNVAAAMKAVEAEISQLRILRDQVANIDDTLSESNIGAIRVALSDVEAVSRHGNAWMALLVLLLGGQRLETWLRIDRSRALQGDRCFA